jgi:predicted DNA-binding transcriptional regulator AlpA
MSAAFVPPPGFVTVAQAASLLGLKARSLYIYRCKGVGPTSQKIGARVVYDENAIREYQTTQRKRNEQREAAKSRRAAKAEAKMKRAA